MKRLIALILFLPFFTYYLWLDITGIAIYPHDSNVYSPLRVWWCGTMMLVALFTYFMFIVVGVKLLSVSIRRRNH